VQAAKIAAALSSLRSVEVTKSGTLVCGYVPTIKDTFRLPTRNILDYEPIVGPNGEPAIRFAVRSAEEIRCFIVTDTDVVYPPASSGPELDSGIHVAVANAPALVAYSEMLREVERLAVSCERHSNSNLDTLGGSVLLLRRFIMGSVVFGLHPVAAMVWWRRAWNVAKEEIWLPSFIPNPAWDNLEKHAARVEMDTKSKIVF